MKKIYLLFVVPLLMVSSCQQDDDILVTSSPASEFSYKIPLTWNQLFLEVERYSPGYKPPVSARNFAHINLIAYEAIVHGSNGKYQSFSGHYSGLAIAFPEYGEEYNWEISLNAAYEKAFELYFPTAPAEQQFQMLDVSHALRSELQSLVAPDVYQRSVEYGQSVAQAVYDWSAADFWGHEGYLSNTDPGYVGPSGVALWKPTYPDFQPALLPHWGKVRTFAANSSDVVPPPPSFSTVPGSQLYEEAMETRTLVNEIRAGNNEEDYWIAEFWSDDCPILTFTPSGRWVSITNQLIAIERLNMLETVTAYAKVGMALSDAGVKCWGEKYRYNCLRPIDYIREYMDDPDWNTVMCPDGSGGFYTPNFPTYPSGHATFSGAASVVLEDIFGENYIFTDRSHEGRTEFKSTPRTFNSFREMALENAYSRVPLGVHFMSDSDAGSDLGFTIGSKVVELPWK
ncbi:MAG: vanadium-dependent haloperoxidase [Lewinella sp.]|uniref:vanadium-dependent haloperoxidase n=1 Tax=Lewinella sp. TaxID=2004506 RepID=UPI003D6B9915